MLWGWALREADSVWCGGLSLVGTIYSPIQPPPCQGIRRPRGECFLCCVYKALNFQSLIPFLKKAFSTSHQNSSYNPVTKRARGLQEAGGRRQASPALQEHALHLSHYLTHMFTSCSIDIREPPFLCASFVLGRGRGSGGQCWLISSSPRGREGEAQVLGPPGPAIQSWGARSARQKGPCFQGLKLLLESRLPGRPLTLSGPLGCREPASSELFVCTSLG